jgi:ubiquinone/menaquinone biosynthesis C-methylase UbiE
MKTNKNIHSQEYISDDRYDWWNKDYLSLLLGRIDFNKNIHSIADLGSGAAHWVSLLLREADSPRTVTCIDFEEHWLIESRKTLSALPISHKIETVLSDVHHLPIDDNSFDLVTCQTVLMHCKDPQQVVDEMFRITKPNGYVLISEPTNLLSRMQFFDSVAHLSVKDQSILYSAWASYHKGQQAISGANHDIAPHIPHIIQKAGFRFINAYANDRVDLIQPETVDFSVMQAEYQKDEFVTYAKAGGASDDDIETARAVFNKLIQTPSLRQNLNASPSNCFAFVGQKPEKS